MADKETDVSWALKLLTADPEKEASVLSGYTSPILAGISGFLTALYVNYASRRPMFSGIQKHLTFPLIGGGLVYWWQLRTLDSAAERDAVYRHYITLHPEDFPEPERKKFRDILKPWYPVR